MSDDYEEEVKALKFLDVNYVNMSDEEKQEKHFMLRYTMHVLLISGLMEYPEPEQEYVFHENLLELLKKN